MTKKTKAMLGPVLDEVMMSFRPVGPREPEVQRTDGLNIFEADRFLLQHDESWVDETAYLLAEPDQGAFRRNLVVMREPVDELPTEFQNFARDRLEGLAEVTEGFDLIAETEVEIPGSPGGYAASFDRSTPGGGSLRQEVVMAMTGTELILALLSTEPPTESEGASPFAGIPGSLAVRVEAPHV